MTELASVLGWVQPALGFVSTALVAIVALGFGCLFVFFSGASALVLGQFVGFARPLRIGPPAIAIASLAWLALSWQVGQEPVYVSALAQLLFGGIAYGVLRAPIPQRAILVATGVVLLLGAGSWVLAIFFPPLLGPAEVGLALAGVCLLGGALGLGPLILAGLIAHRMSRPIEWFISLRYLVAKRRQTFISIISVICVTGVALGVAVITVVLSVMNGFSRVWEDKILGTRAHFVVQSYERTFPDYMSVRDRVRAMPGVSGATPFIEAEAILRGDGGELEAILLKGIDPATVSEATRVREDMIEGSIDALDPADDALGDEDSFAYPGIVIGVQLASRYRLSVGDPVILISPLGGPSTPLGPAPRMARFRVAGVFDSNFFQFDERFAYTSLGAAQSFLKIGDVVNGIEAKTPDPYTSQAVAQEVALELGGLFYTRDWKMFYPEFFNALKMERSMMFVLLSFIMVVAGFIIIATLIMMIMEKSRDIAILKAMGCEDAAVLRVFAIQGVLIGLGGLALGLAMGLVITWNLELIQTTVEKLLGFDVLPGNVYQLQQLPYYVVPQELVLISLIAMVLSIGATLLPSWQASRLDPAEALRFE